MKQKRLIIIGGGAAGFFCAANAAHLNPSLEIVIVEKTNKVLQKVKVSGGGRCNVTHACFDIEEMAMCYPRGARFMKKAFYQFFTTDTLEWFQSRGVTLKTEPDGRMFPVSDSSQTIIDCLTNEIERHGVVLRLNSSIEKIEPTGAQFNIQFASGVTEQADFVLIACGGFSKSSQFDWLKNLNLKIDAPVPSLFSFNFPNHPLNQLMGIAVPDAQIKIGGTKLSSRGATLITHWGLSGPAVLRLSAFSAVELAEMNYQFSVLINWCPLFNEQTIAGLLQQQRHQSPNQKPHNGNFTGLPSRLWEFMLEQAGIDNEKRWSDLTSAMTNKLAKCICAYEMKASGKTTFKEEFVSAGGVSLSEINVNTMGSKKHPGLYFAGEIINVDGITGGYNFQHAWTSGFIAAQHICSLTAPK